MSWSLEAILNRVNWRMAFIFVPAFASGRWKDMGLYTPFMFGYVLSSARTELFRMTSQGLLSNVKATAMAIAQIIGFIGSYRASMPPSGVFSSSRVSQKCSAICG